MKKILCVLVLTCLVFGAVFAQQRPTTPAPAPAQPAKPATPPPAPAKPAEAPQELKNAIGLDLFQLFKGFIATDIDSKFSVFIISAAYEGLVAPHFSVGGDMDLYFMKFDSVDGFYFSLAAEGRYYPTANFDKFFLGATLGFNTLSIDRSAKPEDGGFTGLFVSLKTGYKLITSKNFYIEPSLSYVLSKSSAFGDIAEFFGGPSIPTPLGWNGGLRLGFVF